MKNFCFKSICFSVLAFILVAGFSATNTFAGELNEYEQAFLSKASEGYYYEDRHFYVAEEYLNQARSRFMDDDYDLSKENFDKIMTGQYDYVKQGILDGYLFPSDGLPVDYDALRGIVAEEEDPDDAILEDLKERYRKEIESENPETGENSSDNPVENPDDDAVSEDQSTNVEMKNAIERAMKEDNDAHGSESTESFIILEDQEEFDSFELSESIENSGPVSTTAVEESANENDSSSDAQGSIVVDKDPADDYFTVSFPESDTVTTITVIVVAAACAIVAALAVMILFRLRPKILSNRVKHFHGSSRKVFGAIGATLSGIFFYALMLMTSVLLGLYSESSISGAFIESGYYTKLQDELVSQAKVYAVERDIDTDVIDNVFSIKQISVDGDNYVRAAKNRARFIFNKKALSEKLLDEILKSSGDIRSVTLAEFTEAQDYADELANMYCEYVTNTFIADHFIFGDRVSGNISLVIAINVTLIIVLLIVMYLTQRYAYRVVKYVSCGLLAAGVLFFFVCGILGLPDFLGEYRVLYNYGFIADLIVVLVSSYKIIGIVLGIASSVLASVLYHGSKIIKKGTDFRNRTGRNDEKI